MTTISQLSTTEPKKQNQTKQTTRTGTESQKWRSHGGVSVGGGRMGRKCTGHKKHNCQAPNRQGEIKNSIGNGEAKELICTAHGHELRGECQREGDAGWRGRKGRKKWDNCNSTINKIYLKKEKSPQRETFC